MSGGSYDYAYIKVEDMADRDGLKRSPLRRAFATHLKKVAKAMHDIEWVDSGDYGEGDDVKAITECLGDNSQAMALIEAIKEAETIRDVLIDTINKAKD